MNFKTPNIVATKIISEDKELYCKVYTDPEIMKYIGNPLSQESVERAWTVSVEQETITPVVRKTWALTEIGSNKSIGIAAFGLENKEDKIATIGCMFVLDAHGKGYATEVLRKVTELAFEEYGVNKLTSYSVFANKASYKLMVRLGYGYKEVLTDQDEIKAGYYWFFTKREWLNFLKTNKNRSLMIRAINESDPFNLGNNK